MKLRLTRFADAVERSAGARPGAPLQVDFRGAEAIEQAIQRAGRRFVLAGFAGAAAAAAAVWLADRRVLNARRAS